MKTSRHHRKPRSLGGTNEKRNISYLDVKSHRAWHKLFDNLPPEKIAALINEVYLDPDFYFECKPREE